MECIPSRLRAKSIEQPWRRQCAPQQGDPQLCGGNIEWEPGTKWWTCKKCGFIGSLYWQGHYPAARDPDATFKKAVAITGVGLTLGAIALFGKIFLGR